MEETHFLIHPTNLEPFGIVICEANAYGIPVIGTNVEGLNTTIKDGKNGYLFKKNKFINEASARVKTIINNFEPEYTSLFNNSLLEYKSRLNWLTAATRVKEIFNNYL